MTKLTLREASRRLLSDRLSASTKGTGGYQFEAAELQTPDLTPVLEAQIAALRAVSELLGEQPTDTRREDVRWLQKAERLALPPGTGIGATPPPPSRWWQPAW